MKFLNKNYFQVTTNVNLFKSRKQIQRAQYLKRNLENNEKRGRKKFQGISVVQKLYFIRLFLKIEKLLHKIH
jgi:hypothetical protein